MSLVGPRPIRPALLRAARGRAAGVLAAARRPPGPDRLRPGAARLRDLDGREARARPRVDRRPLGAALPAHADRDRLPDRRPDAAEHLQAATTRLGGHVRDLRNRLARAGPPTPSGSRAMSATLVHRGPDSDGAFVDGPVGLAARRLAIIDLETGDQPIANEDGTRSRRPERRALQLPRAARRARARRPPLSHARRHRGARPPLRAGRARASPSACAGCSRSRSGTRRAAGSCSRATASGSSRSTTATAPAGSRSPPSCAALPRGEIDLDALEAFLAFNSIPAPLTIFREARKLPPGHVLVWEDGEPTRSSATRGPRRSPADELRDDDEAELVEELRARLRDSVRAHLRLRRAGRRAALRRHRLVRARRAGRAGERRAGADVLDRLRGALVRRARRRAARRRALRHRPPRARAAARRGAAPAGAGRRLRRAVRRLVGAADLPRLAARRRGRQGRALGRGRRRALRRLLHLRRRPARARGPGGLARLARPLVERLPTLDRAGELRLQGEALRPRRAPAAARAPPRLEGDLLARRARRADRPARTASTRSTSTARASPRPRAPSRSRGCRTSTSASTSSTTCS